MGERECACKRLFGTLPERVATDRWWGWSIGTTLQATDPVRPHVSYSDEMAAQVAWAIREAARVLTEQHASATLPGDWGRTHDRG